MIHSDILGHLKLAIRFYKNDDIQILKKMSIIGLDFSGKSAECCTFIANMEFNDTN